MKKDSKDYLKKRFPVKIDDKRRGKSFRNARIKFGVCAGDCYNMDYTLCYVIANYLYQYLGDASRIIVREDWETIEKHADAIRDYAGADSWDKLSTEKGIKSSYLKKEKDFKNAMKWLAEELPSLWW